jgi:hypothetical protein
VLSHWVKPEGKTPGEEVLPLLLERVEKRTVHIPQQAFETQATEEGATTDDLHS